MSVEAPARPGASVTTDRGWFEEAVRRHYRLVFSIAYQLLGSAPDAEDAAQEAFLRAYRGRASLAAPGALEGWLAQIARNAALDLGRRRGRDAALRQAAAARAPGEAAPPAAPAADERERLRAAIAALPEHEAIVVTLRFLEGLSATEIGAKLGIDSGAVRVRLHRALKRLRGALGKEQE